MSLLAAFNIDEASGDVIDVTGNGHSWTLNTGAQRTAAGGGVDATTGGNSGSGKGLTKLGTGMAVLANPAFGQTTARSFMLWMKGAGNGVWIFRFYITGADTGSWGLYLLGGNLTLRLRKGGSNTNITTPFPGDGNWHHVAGTYDGTNSRLYLDSTLVATSGTVTAPLDTADLIDCLETSLTTQTIDDIRIHDEVLSQPTIATLMSTPVAASEGSTGVLLGTLSLPTAALVGDSTATATLAGTVLTPVSALTGTATGSGVVAGQLSGALGALAGSARSAGQVAGIIPLVTGELNAGARSDGDLFGAVTEAEASLTGSIETEGGILLGVLPSTTGSVTGDALSEGSIAAMLPAAAGELVGAANSEGQLSGVLPSLSGIFTGEHYVPSVGGLVIVLPQLVSITGRMRYVTELNEQRRMTRQFIAASPVDIALIPNTEARTASGAVSLTGGVPRPIQRFRLIPMSHTERPDQSTTGSGVGVGGVQRKYDLTLLGEWDAVVQPNDYWFDESGQKYVVDAVISFNGYETKGLVMSYGRRASIVA